MVNQTGDLQRAHSTVICSPTRNLVKPTVQGCILALIDVLPSIETVLNVCTINLKNNIFLASEASQPSRTMRTIFLVYIYYLYIVGNAIPKFPI